ncbi:TIGR02444 family protein [Oceanimonas sp. CHS3-5]|uniref:TIGR02444 family protein n=1 Tax=Oceanimonas sp. CHS3-5 TaxID=3068186 RepID=UPI00273EE924|nr:TIGR02444 family protein [Oceanimonas sp. CHS3-5]MDP5293479.1 TIGR02444 family protein [Oceanimonas sp. CHS3-5]
MISADELWQFSEQHYGRPGVAAACLELQDAHDANVNLMLLLLLLEERGLTVDIAPFAPTLENRRGMFAHWRTLRRRLKAQLDADDYAQLLQHELELERWQQQELLSVLAGLPVAAGSGALLTYLNALQVADAPLWQLKLAG